MCLCVVVACEIHSFLLLSEDTCQIGWTIPLTTPSPTISSQILLRIARLFMEYLVPLARWSWKSQSRRFGILSLMVSKSGCQKPLRRQRRLCHLQHLQRRVPYLRRLRSQGAAEADVEVPLQWRWNGGVFSNMYRRELVMKLLTWHQSRERSSQKQRHEFGALAPPLRLGGKQSAGGEGMRLQLLMHGLCLERALERALAANNRSFRMTPVWVSERSRLVPKSSGASWRYSSLSQSPSMLSWSNTWFAISATRCLSEPPPSYAEKALGR